MTVDLINTGNKQPRRTCPASAGGCGIVAQMIKNDGRRSLRSKATKFREAERNEFENWIIIPAQRVAEV